MCVIDDSNSSRARNSDSSRALVPSARRLLGCLAFSVLVTAFTIRGLADEHDIPPPFPQQAPNEEPAQARQLIDDLARISDTYFAARADDPGFLGAAVAFSTGNARNVSMGYGFADLGQSIPVDAGHHLFRIASQTKVFTALAVMQLVEDGIIGLSNDVLPLFAGIEIRGPYTQPISYRHLLQHTSGIDDDYVGLGLHHPARHESLQSVLRDRGIDRIRQAGLSISYTNRSMMLLGHLVEKNTDRAYEEYMQRRVFDTLGMKNARFVVDPTETSDIAVGSVFANGRLGKLVVWDTLTRPSGDMWATAADMAGFLDMLVNGGSIGDREFLKPETVSAMLTDCFAFVDGQLGRCLGLDVYEVDGLRVYGHGGHSPGYRSFFAIIPKLHFAVFAVTNNDTAIPRDEFLRRLINSAGDTVQAGIMKSRANMVTPPIRPGNSSDGLPFAGYYRHDRLLSGFEKYFYLRGGDERVTWDIKNNLVFQGRRYTHSHGETFRSADNRSVISFATDPVSADTFLITDDDTLRQLDWYETPPFQRALITLCLLNLLFGTVWLLASVFRKAGAQRFAGCGPVAETTDRLATGLRLTGAISCMFWLATVTAFFLLGPKSVIDIVYGFSTPDQLLLFALRFGALVTIVYLITAVVLMRRWSEHVGVRLSVVLTLIAQLFLIWDCAYWELI